MIELKNILTFSDGQIFTNATLNIGILEDYTIEETVGDEQYIKAGDLQIKTRTAIPGTQAAVPGQAFIGLYINSTLVQVYDKRPVDEDFDYNTRLYTYRFRSLAAVFYERIKNNVLQYDATSTNYNYAIAAGAVALEGIKVKTPEVLTAFNVFGYSLADIIENLAGTHNSNYFQIGTVTNAVVPTLNSNNLPIVFRGNGNTIATTSLSSSVDQTFYQSADNENFYNMSLADVFDILLIGWNCFFRIDPVIDAGYLKVNLTLHPKVKIASSSPSSKTWSNARIAYGKYKVDGVKMIGENFDFSIGAKVGFVIKKNLKISNPDVAIDPVNPQLYWVAGDYLGSTHSGYPYYDVLTVGGDNRPYADEGILDPYYTNMVASGNGVSGEIQYGSEKTLDQFTLFGGSETYQITKLSIRRNNLAEVEAIEINV